MGSGTCPEGLFPGELQDLVEPVAAATSNEPMYDGDGRPRPQGLLYQTLAGVAAGSP